jgi:multiple sugar transport system permease protein
LVGTPMGLFFAYLLDKNIRLTRFYQSVFYMPVVLSLAIVGFIAQLVYSRDHGALNVLIGRASNPIDWLGDPKINIWAVLVAAVWRHTGYVMVLYLAGLKAVDPALKEAAAIDGANAGQTFFRVVFPTLRPINIIVLVITVIEALRAFDLVYAINSGRNGLELLSVLVTQNIVGEASRIGFGSAIAVILLTTSLGFVIAYLTQITREERQ